MYDVPRLDPEGFRNLWGLFLTFEVSKNLEGLLFIRRLDLPGFENLAGLNVKDEKSRPLP
ncbi:hypothetical protein MM236_14000 [Belliella sp. DSM 107340]|uniref:Uncharacterized protein n=1 Tax=Belliella calami TaxID=2923436 RepID=A0ABS9US69_9BACT|nr:hypothetical protein [Belliella calami]MCH7399113.1 hypothetical protein [Belliella calami]